MPFETFLDELAALLQAAVKDANSRLSTTWDTYGPSSRDYTFEVKGRKFLFHNLLNFIEAQRAAYRQGAYPAGDPYTHFERSLEVWEPADFIHTEGQVEPEFVEHLRALILEWAGARALPGDEEG